MNNSEKLIKNTAVLMLGTIGTKILAFFIIPIFSRWLSREDYGMFDLYSTYVTLLIPVLTLSCGEAVFRFLIDTNDNKEKRKIVSTGFLIVLVGIVLGAVLLGYLVNKTITVKLAVVFYMVSEVLNNYLVFYIRGEKKLKLYVKASIIQMLLVALFVTAFVYKLRLGLEGILFGYGCAYLASDIFIAITSRFYRVINVKAANKYTAIEMLKYSFPLIPNTIFIWILNASDRTIINWSLGASVLGVYSIASKIPSLCSALFGVFRLSWQQSVSETINDAGKDVFYNDVLNNLICTTTSIAIGVLGVNFIMFDYVFDAKYADAYWQSGILVSAVVLSSIGAYLGGIFIGQKDSKSNLTTTIIPATANVVLHLALVNFIGVYAASASTLIAYALLVFLRWVKVKKNIKLRVKKKTWLIILVLCYYVIMQYFRIQSIEYINLLAAVVLFLFINKNFIIGIFKKVLSRT